MSEIGKWLITLGLVIAATGVVFVLAGKFPWLGRLPGDIHIKRENVTIYFPLVTCIIVSAVVSFILWLLRK